MVQGLRIRLYAVKNTDIKQYTNFYSKLVLLTIITVRLLWVYIEASSKIANKFNKRVGQHPLKRFFSSKHAKSTDKQVSRTPLCLKEIFCYLRNFSLLSVNFRKFWGLVYKFFVFWGVNDISKNCFSNTKNY